MTIFFDNCIPRKLVEALQLVQFDVVHLQEIWQDRDNPGGVDDETWIPEVGNRGFIVVSGDHRLTTKPSQVIALQKANLIVYIVYVDFVRQRIPDQARWLFRCWHNIEHHSCSLSLMSSKTWPSVSVTTAGD